MSSPAQALHAADISYQIHPHSNFANHERTGPVVMTRGHGVYVYDDTGKEYLEAMSGLWCATLGFSEQRLVDAAAKQMQALPYYQNFADRATAPAIELAENLIRHAPSPMSKVLFQSSGSEANDTAVKLAWYFHAANGQPRKRKVISRKRGYHGTSVLTGSLTGLPNLHNGFNLPQPGVIHVACPHFYRGAEAGEDEAAYARRLVAELEATILEHGADTIAAFIAEPVMGTGGVILPPADYFALLQPVLKRHGILLIVDEVICGMGRTGHWWGSELYGLKPDILTCAKGLSAAYLPLSATLFTDEIYQVMKAQTDRIGPFGHGYTYGAHPVCAAVANEVFRIIEERQLIAHVAQVGARLQTRLRALADRPLVGEVRGVGLMGAIEFVADKQTKAVFAPGKSAAARVGHHALELGLNVRPLGDTVVLAPPLICTPEEIDLIADRLTTAIELTEREFR